MIEVIKEIMNACINKGIITGIHTGSSEYAIRSARWGFNFITLLSDIRLVVEAAERNIREVKEGLNICL